MNAVVAYTIKRPVRIWLMLGLGLVFLQVVIGGITRLTGSGLSITEWEIVTGILPPLNEVQWLTEFEKYKETPQYDKINRGMDLSSFKIIYFWEYFHRLWARTMGFVFAIPFAVFVYKSWIPKWLMKRLGVLVLLAALAASFGWIMVASGLEERPWVNAYKLTIHLSIACLVFVHLLWTILMVEFPDKKVFHNSMLKRWSWALVIIVSLQIVLGGIMAGMKAALFYPTWPDMHGSFLPEVLLNAQNWNVDNFVDYDKSPFLSALIHFLHRNAAYSLIIIGLIYFFKARKFHLPTSLKFGNNMLITMLVIQTTLGIITVLLSVGNIPVLWGVLHQAGGILLLLIVVFNHFHFTRTRSV